MEYTGRINVPKDTMLFVVNEIFNQNVKESISKEEILKLIPEVYAGQNVNELLKVLSYKGYKSLEELIKFYRTNKDIEKFVEDVDYQGIYSLEETMIIVLRTNKGKCNYSINPGSIENLGGLFTEENRKLAKEYDDMVKIVKGILYTYGILPVDVFYKFVSKYSGKSIDKFEIDDICFKNLELNLLVNEYKIEKNDYISWLNDECVDVCRIVKNKEDRNLKFKEFTKKEILRREEFVWDDNLEKAYNFISKRNNRFYKGKMIRIIELNQLGYDIKQELFEQCNFRDIDEANEFLRLFLNWYNNSPQYELAGFAPLELAKLKLPNKK